MAQKTVLLLAMSLGYGGAETHVTGLADRLQRRNWRVIVGSAGGPLETNLHQAGVCHVKMTLSDRSLWTLGRACWRLRRLLRTESIDLIHAHARIPAWVADFVRRRNRPPLVTTFHGTYKAGFPLADLTRWGDHIITVSEDIKDYMVEAFSAPEDRIDVIQNGIDKEQFTCSHSNPELARRFKLDPSRAVILHASRLTDIHAKTALALIEAAPEIVKRWPGVQFLIIGGGERFDDVRQQALQTAGQHGLRISVPGAQADMASVYPLADVVVAVARTALEAMACGKPVVICGEGGYRGICDQALAPALHAANFTARGSKQPVSPAKLTQAFDVLFSDPDRRQRLGEFGRRLVVEHYSIDSMVDEIEEVYLKLID